MVDVLHIRNKICWGSPVAEPGIKMREGNLHILQNNYMNLLVSNHHILHSKKTQHHQSHLNTRAQCHILWHLINKVNVSKKSKEIYREDVKILRFLFTEVMRWTYSKTETSITWTTEIEVSTFCHLFYLPRLFEMRHQCKPCDCNKKTPAINLKHNRSSHNLNTQAKQP